jgi:hypothetical protein
VPALADELAPQLFGQVDERERRRPDDLLEPAPLAGEVVRQLPLVVGERDLDGVSVSRRQPRQKGRRRLRQREDLLGRPGALGIRSNSQPSSSGRR